MPSVMRSPSTNEPHPSACALCSSCSYAPPSSWRRGAAAARRTFYHIPKTNFHSIRPRPTVLSLLFLPLLIMQASENTEGQRESAVSITNHHSRSPFQNLFQSRLCHSARIVPPHLRTHLLRCSAGQKAFPTTEETSPTAHEEALFLRDARLLNRLACHKFGARLPNVLENPKPALHVLRASSCR